MQLVQKLSQKNKHVSSSTGMQNKPGVQHFHLTCCIFFNLAFHQLCTTALANLTAEYRQPNDDNQLFFSKDKVNIWQL
jgi:hypothetical protein